MLEIEKVYFGDFLLDLENWFLGLVRFFLGLRFFGLGNLFFLGVFLFSLMFWRNEFCGVFLFWIFVKNYVLM